MRGPFVGTGAGDDARGAKKKERIVRSRMRIGGFDARHLMYKGTVELEEFYSEEVGVRGTFCVMKREKVGRAFD